MVRMLIRWPLFAAIVALGAAAGIYAGVLAARAHADDDHTDYFTDDEPQEG